MRGRGQMVYDTAQTTSMPKMTIKMPYHCSRAVVFSGLPTNQIRPKSMREGDVGPADHPVAIGDRETDVDRGQAVRPFRISPGAKVHCSQGQEHEVDDRGESDQNKPEASGFKDIASEQSQHDDGPEPDFAGNDQ